MKVKRTKSEKGNAINTTHGKFGTLVKGDLFKRENFENDVLMKTQVALLKYRGRNCPKINAVNIETGNFLEVRDEENVFPWNVLNPMELES